MSIIPRGRRLGPRWICATVALTVALGLAVAQGPIAVASGTGSAAPRGSKAITPAKGTTVTSRFFGMHSSTLLGSFPAVPAGAVDLMTNGVYWPDLETSPGVFDFTKLESLVAQAEAHHARPLLILGQTPSFHAAPGTTYTNLASRPDPAAWEAYVQAVVSKFGTRLDYQIWPEPNVEPNWVGTPQQMANLVASAATIIHRVAPGATVVAPGMVLRLQYERIFMRDFYSKKVNGVPIGKFVDAVGLDPYPKEEGGPEEALDLIKKAQRILRLEGVEAPTWTVEVNYGAQLGTVGDADHSSWSKQSSLVVRTYLLSAGVGVRRVFWLGWSRYRNLNVQMLEPDMVTPSPAAHAYTLMARWLTGQRARGCYHDAARDLYSCAFVRDGRTSWAYWTGSGRAGVNAPQGARKVQRATGETSTTKPGKRIRVTTVPIWVRH